MAAAADGLGYDHLTCSEHVVVPTGGGRRAGQPVLGPAGHLRLPGRRDLPDPPGHQRARPRLPPPARDRQALRHPRPDLRRSAHPRPRGRIAGGGVRPAGCPLRRSGATGRRRTVGPPVLAVRTAARVPRPLLPVLGRGARSVRPPIVGAPVDRGPGRAAPSVGPWSWGTAGRPSASGPSTWPPCWPQARDTPAWAARRGPLEVVLRNGRPLDPVGDEDGARRIIGRLVEAGATGAAAVVRPPVPRPTTSSNWRPMMAMDGSKPMNRVKVGFFSLSHASPSGDDRPYLEWHQMDHMPEQYQLPGMILGQRWASTHGAAGPGGGRGRVVAGRARRLLPHGSSGRRDHRRLPHPGTAPGRTGPVLPPPALPLPRGPAAPRGPRRPAGPHLGRGRAVPAPPGHLPHRRGADRPVGPGRTTGNATTPSCSRSWCPSRGWPEPGPTGRPRPSGGRCSPRASSG